MALPLTIHDLLQMVHDRGASDLHLKAGRPPLLRVHGDIVPVEGQPVLEIEDVMGYVFAMINSGQRASLERDRELDFSFYLRGVARFRGNAFFQKGAVGAVFRLIPAKVPTVEDLGLAPILKEIVQRRQGFFLVTGPTGSGKTTTLAALLNHINETQPVHIVTLEDPIEYVFEDKKAVINQREIGTDTHDFAQGLRRALRQDPDVILIGELRDPETMTTAMNAAETGHLVLGTLHTNDAKQTIDRIIDTFPPDQQNQVRLQLAKCLLGVVAQRLVRRATGEGRIALQEIMINTPTVQKLIEDNKIGALGKAIEDSAEYYKMQSFNQALLAALARDQITLEEALSYSPNPNDLKIRLQTEGIVVASGPSAPGRPFGLHP
ncbi:MAG: type IV pilus twitching motility protein PilT [Elusimicrobia bacterium]|nr:type IV pilus twitching motility protein PilT [Elusimicrobiota bacterium]MBP9127330.1 type IV pilus twitching motility protein PilT [Elusimicrobiota bacterium]MBP9698595.1 type IV pilus twitching motility protein PilT [Elusimicrobiota bacterium]